MLPERYYLDYFNDLLAFVFRHYALLLSSEEHDFLRAFSSLSTDAQALYVRMITRKGIFFKPQHFQYPEISSIPNAVGELLRNNFLREVGDLALIHKIDYLNSYTKPQLCQLFFLKNQKKDALVWHIASRFEWKDILSFLQALDKTYQLCQKDLVEWFFFLFFGHLEENLTEFVLRDLGKVRFEHAHHDKFIPHFTYRQEARDKFFAQQQYVLFKKIRTLFSSENLLQWYHQQRPAWEKVSSPARYFIDKIALRLAQILEKEGKLEEALQIYAQTTLPPARERRVRLMLKHHQTVEALALCRQMQHHPYNADELFFAIDTLEKHNKKIVKKTTTTFLEEGATTLFLTKKEKNIEECVLSYFKQQGEEGFFAENYVWNALFGLAFWDVIFDKTQVHHPFERQPIDFLEDDFFEKRKEKFLQKAAIFHRRDTLQQTVFQTFKEKKGTINPLVGWYDGTCDWLEKIFQYVESLKLKEVMLQMAKDLKNHTKGFPDLFVFGKKGGRFVEIKSLNDQLSAQQLYWIQFFRRIEIPVELVRVRWKK